MKCCHWLHQVFGAGLLLAAGTVPAIAADDDSGKKDSGEGLFKQLDRNNDGVIVADELGPEQQRMFQRLVRSSDANNDGKLSREEFEAGIKDTPPARDGSGNNRREGDARREGQPSAEQAEMFFKRLDANGDGMLVIEEVPEDRRPRVAMLFERADANGDKSLTLVEFTKGLAMMRGDGGGQPGQRPGTPPGPPPPPPSDALFKALDTNDDGKISKDEIEAAPKSLAKLDRDEDGQITRRELGGPRNSQSASNRPDGEGAPNGQQMLKRMDKNDDGKLSKDEVGERMRDNFDRIDTNGDGFIDGPELGRMLRTIGRGGDGQGRGDGQRPDPKQMLARLDTNKDGKLSKDEAPEWMRNNFDHFDANGDGFVDADELARSAARSRAGQPGNRRPPADGDDKK